MQKTEAATLVYKKTAGYQCDGCGAETQGSHFPDEWVSCWKETLTTEETVHLCGPCWGKALAAAKAATP